MTFHMVCWYDNGNVAESASFVRLISVLMETRDPNDEEFRPPKKTRCLNWVRLQKIQPLERQLGLKTFEAWISNQTNNAPGEDQVPEDILSTQIHSFCKHGCSPNEEGQR